MITTAAQWWVQTFPFWHLRAINVLGPADYSRISAAFSLTLESSRTDPPKPTHENLTYDADIIGLNSESSALFEPLFSPTWIDALYKAVSFPNVGRVDGAIHSSAPGSRTGWIHTDLCSGWFDEARGIGTTTLFPNRFTCDYFHGYAKDSQAKPTEYIRAGTLIYYLCNDGWQQGDGGETGLYTSPRDGAPFELVPPVNDSLLFFPCTPHSYHRFLTNTRLTRNSVILFIHTSVDDACARWGSGINRRSPS